ncbi:MAG: sensor histidine kinase [bacterium]
MKFTSIQENTVKPFLVGIVFLSLALHGVILTLGLTLMADWQWIQHSVHSTIETTGSMIAFVVAFLLLALESRNEGTSYNVRIAGALIGMGFLDAFHAMAPVSGLFVWLHSSSTFFGGVLFVLVWLPESFFDPFETLWPYLCTAVTIVFGILSFVFSENLPEMIQLGSFTTTARYLNLAGGALLIGASMRLGLTYLNDYHFDDLLFCVHCLLFGMAGMMFELSTLWDFSWWGWHFLRLLAYAAALLFAVITFIRDQRTLRNRKDILEEQVANRTEELEQAVKEKEILLKEIHHRVKNNMQIISSMLSLQLQKFDEPSIRESFDESLSRINSMALVHDLLYRSDDFDQVNFADYVHRLFDELRTSLVPGDSEITFETEIEDIRLNIDTAVRCGLIVNELVTNSIQHAFNKGGQGRTRVAFSRINGQYKLEVEDNGSGFSMEDKPTATDSLGLDLVQALVETDLHGEIEMSSNGGTSVTVRFKKDDE